MLRALGIEHALLSSGVESVLVVQPQDALRATNELAAYALETEAAAPPQLPTPPRASSGAGAMGYAVVLVAFFFAQHGQWAGLDWTAAGRTEADLITDGAWWRCFTALFLHGDLAHLAGNLLFGLTFGMFVCQLLGNGVGWLMILLGGALGNGSNAMVQLAEHRSLGASTAVFAALGILVSCSFRQAHTERRSRILRWAPLAAGLALFGLIGVEGENTDVLAHVGGMFWGGLIGLVLAARARLGPSPRPVQLLAGATTVSLLVMAWLAAFAAQP